MLFTSILSTVQKLNSRFAALAMYTVLFAFCTPQIGAAQSTWTGCGPSQTTHAVVGHAGQLLHEIGSVPKNAIRRENLKWELPIGLATGLLIAEADQPAANRVQSRSFQNLAGRWSDAGLGIEIAAAGLTWGAGCIEQKSSLRNNGVTALTAIGAAGTLDLALKLAFDREFPFKPGSHGDFWGGGRSFPSGHAATSFAFASAIAHLYPHNRWVKWGAYALASGVALSRYPAKRHYLSDILVGSALGYVTGTYIAQH